MKSGLTIGLLSIALVATHAYGADNTAFKNDREKTGYAMGMNFGQNMKKQSIDFDSVFFVKGFQDAMSGSKALLTDEEMRTAMTAFQKDLIAKQAEKTKALSEKNKKEGEAFLAANKKKDGVKTTASGLQYKVLKEGTGKIPKDTDTVTVHYRGNLIDGTEFDSSYKRNEPATFPVKDVIAGWTEAVKLMKTGSKWQIYIPANLAYGERGAAPVIGPNATLIFEVELISIK